MLIILHRFCVCQVLVFGHAGKCGPHTGLMAICQQCVRAVWLQTQVGEGRGAVATCLQSGFTGARLWGREREQEEGGHGGEDGL